MHFVFVGDSPRVFSGLGIVGPGDIVEADDNPAPVFFEVAEAGPWDVAPVPEPEPEPAPVAAPESEV